jgi:outer membrane protein assembly factor BamE (lipoprotein component of BamABCDE complex)
LLGNSDALALLQTTPDTATSKSDQLPPVITPTEKPNEANSVRQARLEDLRTRFGQHAEAIIAGDIQMGMTTAEVVEARGTPLHKDSFPPAYELWVYDPIRVAFADGKVTHVGH